MAAANGDILLQVTDLRVRYGNYEAVKGVSFSLGRGEILGIVGESGSGKSTVAKALMKLHPAVDPESVRRGDGVKLAMIFQDAVGSLNPRMTVRETLEETLRVGERMPRSECAAEVRRLVGEVGLSEAVLSQYPREMSGGQCQRVSVARALATRPEVLIADEPVSALDVSVQARVLNLLRELNRVRGLTVVLIAHDLAVVKNVCDRILVMERGEIVEAGEPAAIFADPRHPYTKKLLSAVPGRRLPNRECVAIGFFDGVHLGHRRILAGATKAITFDRHPLSVLSPEKSPRLLQTLEERVDAIRACGVAEVDVREFTAELAALEPAAAPAALGIDPRAGLRCGANWRFGRNGKGNADTLRTLGFEVETVPFVEYAGEPVSSTRIRSSLAAGEVEAANAMLGRPFAVTGEVMRGKGLGASLGFPTVNLALDRECPLPHGVYAVRVGGRRAVANWGLAPTLGDAAWSRPVLEVHFPDGIASPLEGRQRVEVCRFLRPERRFDTLDELKEQIAMDIAAVAEKAKLSVVVTTRNEEANIGNCIRAFDGFRDRVEIIVVDNRSDDRTKEIAAELGATVLDKGPERSAQRNLGWRTAKSDWVTVLDADMILPRPLIEEMLATAEASGDAPAVRAYWIPEVRTGTGWRVKVRNFERSFYDGTCVDALRLFHRSVLEATGGYDEGLIAGPEDWELDIRVLATGAKCAVLKHHLLHNEKRLTYRRMLEKKAYYTRSFAAYRAKWPDHPAVKRQFSPWYRFIGVFTEQGKWRKIVRHPILFAGVMFERFSVGLVYLLKR